MTGCIFFACTLPALPLIDKLGRKPLLYAGSLVMLVSMVIVGGLDARYADKWDTNMAAGWAAAAFLWVYVGTFGATWGPVSWVLVSEIFPLSIRSKGASLGASSNWVSLPLPNLKTSSYTEFPLQKKTNKCLFCS